MNMRIDFHSNVSNQLDYACRLIRKAFFAQCKLIVWHQDKEQLAQFDQLLWTFSATDFLPHVVLEQGNHPLAPHTPILLAMPSDDTFTSLSDINVKHHKVLINLSDKVPTHFAQYERLIEVVPRAPDLVPTDTNATAYATIQAAIQAGRERYRFYQQQGYQINHINAK
jgi:DNA polymerase-3 subunit chi